MGHVIARLLSHIDSGSALRYSTGVRHRTVFAAQVAAFSPYQAAVGQSSRAPASTQIEHITCWGLFGIPDGMQGGLTRSSSMKANHDVSQS